MNHLNFTSDALRRDLLSLPTSRLRPFATNARTHTKHQIRQIAESIRVFGFTNPVLVDRDDQIVAGHGRVEAAKLLGVADVPAIRLEHLSPDQVRAYVIADNKLAENAGWDRDILAIELQNLLTIDSSVFDVTITGFEVTEIDLLVQGSQNSDGPADHTQESTLESDPVTAPGDVWLLNKHRLICGDALVGSTFRELLGNKRAAVTFTDPPFNVRIDGHATGKGSIHHREFQMASGEMSEAEFLSFLNSSLRHIRDYSANGSVAFVCMDWRHAADLIAAGRQNFDELLNVCIWVKNSGGMGSFYRSQHEMVFVFRKGKESHRNNVQLGRFGRNRTNVWQYPGVQTMSKQGDEGNLLALHPTVKPIAMVADAILDCSARGEIILDPFLGSGTTLMAAQRVGRVCYGIEIDPSYTDVAIRRWQKHTGERAVQAATGKTFDEIAAQKELLSA
ncbi:site-specific DNA-methyltransferase [Occallatibacter savannae]|uniref:site-specific DNA-methyltransferase n=1 Tax=Occallatibacter savannae TaxID=1002691 RepID=UPI000D68FC72|nr:DNA methyltransferase [Occallatibacter savannae]